MKKIKMLNANECCNIGGGNCMCWCYAKKQFSIPVDLYIEDETPYHEVKSTSSPHISRAVLNNFEGSNGKIQSASGSRIFGMLPVLFEEVGAPLGEVENSHECEVRCGKKCTSLCV